jgi:DNA-binding transcriptional LysR family regulator
LSERHPLLVYKHVPVEELVHYPFVTGDPRLFGWCSCGLVQLLHGMTNKPDAIEYVASMDMMLTLVSAGYGVGIANAVRIGANNRPDIVTRPIASPDITHTATTYLLRAENGTTLPPSISLDRFLARLGARVNA